MPSRYVWKGLRWAQLSRSVVTNKGKEQAVAKCRDIGDQIFGTRSAPMALKDEFLINSFSHHRWPGNLDDEWFKKRHKIDHIAKKLVEQKIMRDEHADFNEFMDEARKERGKAKLTNFEIFVKRKKLKTPEWLAAHPEIAARYPKDA